MTEYNYTVIIERERRLPCFLSCASRLPFARRFLRRNRSEHHRGRQLYIESQPIRNPFSEDVIIKRIRSGMSPLLPQVKPDLIRVVKQLFELDAKRAVMPYFTALLTRPVLSPSMQAVNYQRLCMALSTICG